RVRPGPGDVRRRLAGVPARGGEVRRLGDRPEDGGEGPPRGPAEEAVPRQRGEVLRAVIEAAGWHFFPRPDREGGRTSHALTVGPRRKCPSQALPHGRASDKMPTPGTLHPDGIRATATSPLTRAAGSAMTGRKAALLTAAGRKRQEGPCPG